MKIQLKQIPPHRNPWSWIPTLYLYQGIPYSIVMTTSGLIYKTMGISVAALAFWTSLLYLPWAIKPLWSPYVEVVSTKRNWIIMTQLLLGVAFIMVGSAMPLSFFFPITVGLFAIIAISSASHDIAADGFYMHALDQHKQAFFVGIRSTFYRIAMLTAMGLLPLIAGLIQEKTGLTPVSLRINAVPAGQYTPVTLPDTAFAGNVKEPAILHYPQEVQVPLFQKGISETDTAVAYIAFRHLLNQVTKLYSTLCISREAKIYAWPKTRPAGMSSPMRTGTNRCGWLLWLTIT